jgi:hypothetical protein
MEMNYSKKLILILIAKFFFATLSFAQNQIKLTVKDSISSEDLVGASITSLNNFLKYKTDNKGDVFIKVSKIDTLSLKVKYLGYQEKIIAIVGTSASENLVLLTKKINLSD